MALFARTRGTGAPVVLLHGSGMSSRQWRSLMVRLEAARRAVAPDLLGCGENPPWPDDAPFRHALDVAAVTEVVLAESARAGGAPVDLVGHSYGGLLALTVARARPDLVRTLAVYDPVAFGVLYEAEGGRADTAEARSELARVASTPALSDPATFGSDDWYRAFMTYWASAGVWDALPAEARAESLRVGRKVAREVSSILSDRTPASAYAAVHAPTLLLTGERTPLAAREVVRVLLETLPRAERVVIPGAGHAGPLSHAALVNEALVAHLARGA
ncbi:MAG TPA: alpha/beta hydrolase [Polyangiaceae bacterium]|nr:alpha/beta hydrolase [Polyangiaceae bacterium]